MSNFLKNLNYKGTEYSIDPSNDSFRTPNKKDSLDFINEFFKRNFHKGYTGNIYQSEMQEFIRYCKTREIPEEQIFKILENVSKGSWVRLVADPVSVQQRDYISEVIELFELFSFEQSQIDEALKNVSEILNQGLKGEKLESKIKDYLQTFFNENSRAFFFDWKYSPQNVLLTIKHFKPEFVFSNYNERMVDSVGKDFEQSEETDLYWNVSLDLLGVHVEEEFISYEVNKLIEKINEVIQDKLSFRLVQYDTGGDSYGFFIVSTKIKDYELDRYKDLLGLYV
jgi:hypothetical protein